MLVATMAAIAVIATTRPEIDVPRRSTFGDDEPHYLRGLELDRRGEHGSAAAEYLIAAKRTPSLARRAAYQASLSHDIAEFEEKLRTDQSSVAHFQTAVQYQNKYWAFFIERNERVPRLFARAASLFQKALALAPTSANPVVCLAALYLQAGDTARSERTIGLLAHRPIQPADEYNYSFYMVMKGELGRAFALLEKTLTRQPFQARSQIEWIIESDDFHGLLDDPRLLKLIARFGRGIAIPKKEF